MGEIFGKIIFLVFVMPMLMFEEGYPKFVAYFERRGWSSPRLWFIIIVLSLFGLILWGMGYR